MAGGYCCYFYWSQNGGEWCGIGAAALMTMMIIVTITVVIVEGRLLLPTGSEFSLSFPWLLSVLAEVPSLYLHCCYRCCCCIVVVICVVASLLFLLLSLSAGVIFVVFGFWSLLLLLSIFFPFFVFAFAIVSLSTPFSSAVLRISGVPTVVIW